MLTCLSVDLVNIKDSPRENRLSIYICRCAQIEHTKSFSHAVLTGSNPK